jgi:hypothetical protein
MKKPEYILNENGMNKKLYNLLKKNKVKGFVLKFSGGSDEGYLDVSVDYRKEGDDKVYTSSYPPHDPKNIEDIKSILYDAAMEGFEYTGAGDGTDYGDNYYFDLETGEIRHEEWYMVEQSSMLPEKKIQLEK